MEYYPTTGDSRSKPVHNNIKNFTNAILSKRKTVPKIIYDMKTGKSLILENGITLIFEEEDED